MRKLDLREKLNPKFRAFLREQDELREMLLQGADVWNKWREINSLKQINLRGMNLANANLRGVNLRGIDLREAKLKRADLSEADLYATNLIRTDLMGAILVGANLGEANLGAADLEGADLSSANLSITILKGANLKRANLSKANLTGASLDRSDLVDANFKGAEIGATTFSNTDLRRTKGLENVKHFVPSTIGTDTLNISKGNIPKIFLRGCGLSDWEIESAELYNPDLTNDEIIKIQYRIYDLRATQAIQIFPLFISYSHLDKLFVDKLDTYLTQKGIRFWRDVHKMTSGRMETQIDRAMRLNPTVLLILSNHSLQSDWVEHEVRSARVLEKEMKRDVLCPVALDDSWKNSPWAKRIMEQIMEYNILDFSEWKDGAKFESTFNKLIDGLELFYK